MQRERIIAEARSWIGTPYLHQTSLKGVGSDCLGLLRGVWRAMAGSEPEPAPPYGAGLIDTGGGELLLEAARRNLREIDPTRFRGGDVLLFRWRPHLPARHVGIATSQCAMVHAQSGSAVAEIILEGWWRARLAAAFEFPRVSSQVASSE
jgi:NlpC/P60 family putative phage cell wall peptidase